VYLPRMIADALRQRNFGVPDDEFDELMAAIAAKFKQEKRTSEAEDADDAEGDGEEQETVQSEPSTANAVDKTGQLVFFRPPFARRIAELVADLRSRNLRAYNRFIGRKVTPKPAKEEEKILKGEIERFIQGASDASKSLTIDIALFGRMTTSDLVVNVEAACQVAHAIGTHETIIETDYFTAMDDKKMEFAPTQTEQAGAGFIGSGDTRTFFNSAVYYKYLNLDLDALKKHLRPLSHQDAASAAGVLLSAAALANPTGKQNAFASHGVPELILVELSKTKRPISYANAFLQPVEGGVGRNLMTESANALNEYIESVAGAFAPADVRRAYLAVGPASIELKGAERKGTLDDLVKYIVSLVASFDKPEAAA
jgi:CRISPR-associated protein Cas7/Cse4/CasC subtype I-E